MCWWDCRHVYLDMSGTCYHFYSSNTLSFLSLSDVITSSGLILLPMCLRDFRHMYCVDIGRDRLLSLLLIQHLITTFPSPTPHKSPVYFWYRCVWETVDTCSSIKKWTHSAPCSHKHLSMFDASNALVCLWWWCVFEIVDTCTALISMWRDLGSYYMTLRPPSSLKGVYSISKSSSMTVMVLDLSSVSWT